MNHKHRIILVVLILLCVGTIYFLVSRNVHSTELVRPSTQQTSQPEPTPTPVSAAAAIPSPRIYKDLIEITSPLPNSKINLVSPSTTLKIAGRARGTWFFEASFPVELQDGAGVVIAKGVAQADGEWMTSDFVPFRATLTFKLTPDQTLNFGGSASLVLKKDNPSGEPKNDDAFIVPVSLFP